MTRSSSLRCSSNEKLYWKPEQPPPSTATRIMTGLASFEARKAIRLAAFSVTEKGSSLMTHKMWIGGPPVNPVGAYLACPVTLPQMGSGDGPCVAAAEAAGWRQGY